MPNHILAAAGCPAPLRLLLLLLLLLGAPLVAQDLDRQARLVEQREQKLAKPFLANAEWFLDYDKARAAADQRGRFLLTYFTRSHAP